MGKLPVHVLLKDWRILSIILLACEMNIIVWVIWTFFGLAFLWDWNENWCFPVLWPLLSFPNCRHNECSTLTASVQLLSYIQLFVTPWTAARQASLSITNSQSLLKLIPIKSVMPSNHLILCYPLLLLPSTFPASGSFPTSQSFISGGQSTGTSVSASGLPMNAQEWFPLGLTGLISLQSKGLSRVFSNTTVQKDQFFSAQLSL